MEEWDPGRLRQAPPSLCLDVFHSDDGGGGGDEYRCLQEQLGWAGFIPGLGGLRY